MDQRLAFAKERAWREVAAIDAAYARGEIDDDGWHRAMAALVVPAYLDAVNVRGGSGHTGSGEDWEWSRGVVAEAVDRSGTFLDVGCANGLLMESVVSWAAAAGHTIVPYGLDISAELADVARRRLPRWTDHIFIGNALGWTAPEFLRGRPRERLAFARESSGRASAESAGAFGGGGSGDRGVPASERARGVAAGTKSPRFEIVRTGLEYVPLSRRRELVAWLLDEVVAPGGRLIVGKYNEEVERRALRRTSSAGASHSRGAPIASIRRSRGSRIAQCGLMCRAGRMPSCRCARFAGPT